MIVFEKGGVAIDVAAEAFTDDHLGVRKIEAGVEVCSRGALNAVIRPEGLGAVGDLNLAEGLGPGVSGSE